MKALERRMKYIFEVSEPHVVEQLAFNCNQILYTAYEAIFETSTRRSQAATPLFLCHRRPRRSEKNS
jgi:hypothetical protein